MDPNEQVSTNGGSGGIRSLLDLSVDEMNAVLRETEAGRRETGQASCVGSEGQPVTLMSSSNQANLTVEEGRSSLLSADYSVAHCTRDYSSIQVPTDDSSSDQEFSVKGGNGCCKVRNDKCVTFRNKKRSEFDTNSDGRTWRCRDVWPNGYESGSEDSHRSPSRLPIRRWWAPMKHSGSSTLAASRSGRGSSSRSLGCEDSQSFTFPDDRPRNAGCQHDRSSVAGQRRAQIEPATERRSEIRFRTMSNNKRENARR
jgi:hypothetical protein